MQEIQWVFRTKPLTVQSAALRASGLRESFAYLMEPGLGKTKVTIDEMQTLFERGALFAVVVLCPKSIKSVWLEQILLGDGAHEPHGVAGMHEVHVLNWDKREWQTHLPQAGPALFTDENTVVDNQIVHDNRLKWYIVGIDSIVTAKHTKKSVTPEGNPDPFTPPTITYDERAYRVVEALLYQYSGSVALVVDESATIRGESSKRSAAVFKLGPLATYRRILNGTLLANTPMDVWAQFHFLDPYIFGGWSYFAFRGRYAVMGGFDNKQIVDYQNQEELAEIVSQHSYVAKKADWLDLPERLIVKRWVELEASALRAYQKIVEEAVLDFGGDVTTLTMATKKIIKLGLVVGGWVKGDAGTLLRMSRAKLEALHDILEDIRGHKFIIWCEFTHEIDFLEEDLRKHGYDIVTFSGKVSEKNRALARHAINTGTADGIIVQNDAGGLGLTLNGASVAIFYSNPEYPLPKEQATERNYRYGQDKATTIYELMVKGSIDECIYNSITNKKSLSDAILNCQGDPVKFRQLLVPPVKTIKWKSIPINKEK
jgi:hypothetical protein